MGTPVRKRQQPPTSEKSNDRIQALLRERGSNGRKFAEEIGLPYLRFRKVACGADTNAERRSKIEVALGQVIWDTPNDSACSSAELSRSKLQDSK